MQENRITSASRRQSREQSKTCRRPRLIGQAEVYDNYISSTPVGLSDHPCKDKLRHNYCPKMCISQLIGMEKNKHVGAQGRHNGSSAKPQHAKRQSVDENAHEAPPFPVTRIR